MTVDAFPDTEALVGYALRTANLAGVGTRVYSSIPGSPTWPLILVHRSGGMPMERHRWDGATIQIESWGTSKSNAYDIIALARQAVHEMEGVKFTVAGGAPADVFVSAVDDNLAVTWQPDDPTGRDRYIFGARLIVRNL